MKRSESAADELLHRVMADWRLMADFTEEEENELVIDCSFDCVVHMYHSRVASGTVAPPVFSGFMDCHDRTDFLYQSVYQ